MTKTKKKTKLDKKTLIALGLNGINLLLLIIAYFSSFSIFKNLSRWLSSTFELNDDTAFAISIFIVIYISLIICVIIIHYIVSNVYIILGKIKNNYALKVIGITRSSIVNLSIAVSVILLEFKLVLLIPIVIISLMPWFILFEEYKKED